MVACGFNRPFLSKWLSLASCLQPLLHSWWWSYYWSSGPSVETRIRSERREDVRTSDFILFWALKALSQLAELIGQNKKNLNKLISVGLLQHLVQVQVGLAMKIIRHSPLQDLHSPGISSTWHPDWTSFSLNHSVRTFSSLLPYKLYSVIRTLVMVEYCKCWHHSLCILILFNSKQVIQFSIKVFLTGWTCMLHLLSQIVHQALSFPSQLNALKSCGMSTRSLLFQTLDDESFQHTIWERGGVHVVKTGQTALNCSISTRMRSAFCRVSLMSLSPSAHQPRHDKMQQTADPSGYWKSFSLYQQCQHCDWFGPNSPYVWQQLHTDQLGSRDHLLPCVLS